ncbi:SusE domain-containing protein [Dysgonomonas sp. Marseille-P4677]|uniref:SusE domain-containing protein n=1 Tax=Dysgonomonas sp. Marseille-P4677 TaxID=2364790 RepID=UPI001F40ACF2|nr:SusE domain-containing protein [Dysgonomonas sp. Marseille-P4677]
MKKIYLVLMVLLTIFISCDDDYSLSTDFSIPTELDSPDYIYVDLESSDQIRFSWSGGGAKDGSYVLYEVLFDKEGGDFSNPIYLKKSEYNTDPELRMTTEELGVIARKAGINPLSKGKVIWTVRTSKGGVTHSGGLHKEVLLERSWNR